MTKTVPVKLKWEGPIGIGNLPTDEGVLENMQNPGIYIYTLDYPEKLVAYAGKSKNILLRIKQHYGGYLGTSYWLRDGKGSWKIDPQKGFESLNKIDKKGCLAMVEAKRLRFYYAILKNQEGRLIRPAESLIIRVLKDKYEAEEIIWGKKFECENGRREGYGKNSPPINLTHDFSLVTRRSKLGKEALSSLMGKVPLIGPLK